MRNTFSTRIRLTRSIENQTWKMANNLAAQQGFVVERLLDRRADEFFVKWLGYPHSENTWEPSRNLSAELRAEYVGIEKSADEQPLIPREEILDALKGGTASLPACEWVRSRQLAARPSAGALVCSTCLATTLRFFFFFSFSLILFFFSFLT